MDDHTGVGSDRSFFGVNSDQVIFGVNSDPYTFEGKFAQRISRENEQTSDDTRVPRMLPGLDQGLTLNAETKVPASKDSPKIPRNANLRQSAAISTHGDSHGSPHSLAVSAQFDPSGSTEVPFLGERGASVRDAGHRAPEENQSEIFYRQSIGEAEVFHTDTENKSSDVGLPFVGFPGTTIPVQDDLNRSSRTPVENSNRQSIGKQRFFRPTPTPKSRT